MAPPVCGFQVGLFYCIDPEHKGVDDIDTKSNIGSEKDQAIGCPSQGLI